ncbi:MAG: SH3 domain-containing protein [Chloroflexi bacterium]|nr:SH3 domain-containing protein [Chloroflexota bacterium]
MIDLSLSEGAASVTQVSQADFLANETWQTAAAALPANTTLVGDVVSVSYEGAAPKGSASLKMPTGAAAATLDLFGWHNNAWAFIPTSTSGEQIVTAAGELPQLFALVQTGSPASRAMGTEILPTQEMPAAAMPLLSEVTVGSLTLGEGGSLSGDIVAIPDGVYQQFIRVTNTGVVADTQSLVALLTDATAQSANIQAIVDQVTSGNYAGANIDYQGVPAAQREAFNQYLTELAAALQAQNKQLAVTLDTPTQDTSGTWNSGGQDWAAIGQIADIVYVKMPLSPAAYVSGGPAEQLLDYAIHQINRRKLSMVLSAYAVDTIDETFIEMPNEQALTNFGEVTLTEGSAELEPASSVAVALTGTASELAWDGGAWTYRYSYEQAGQTHTVWLGNEAAVNVRLLLANRYNLRGAAVRGLGTVGSGEGYATAMQNYLSANADTTLASAASIIWTVKDTAGSVLANQSGLELAYAWEGSAEPGEYTIEAGFAQGEEIASLGSLTVNVQAPPTPTPVPTATTEAVAANPTPNAAAPSGGNTSGGSGSTTDANATVSSDANVRTGPGVTYGSIAGGVRSGTRVTIIGRTSDNSWYQVIIPAGQEGWIFASLITPDSTFDPSSVEVVEVTPPATTGGSGSSGGTTPPSGPPPPVSIGSFELGGQTHSLAHPAQMNYAGMTWVKFQHKWGSGDSADAVAGRIQSAHANGFKVLLSIPGSDHSNIDFGAYVAFLGGVAALGPDAIEVWNEMNIDREWPAGQISPSTYTTSMLAPAYQAIKAANANVMVISGAPAPTGFYGGCSGAGCNDDQYVAGMAAAGAANYMDCIGIHYNEGIIPPSQTSGDPRSEHYTRYFWGMVNAYYNAFGGSRKLCFTELGYLSGDGYPGIPGGFSWASGTSVAEHAAWLAEATSLAGNSGKVRMLIVFNVDFTYYDPNGDPQAGYGMIRPDGGCPACDTLHAVTGGR